MHLFLQIRILFFILFPLFQLVSQTLVLEKSIPFKGIQSVSTDIRDHFYISDIKGNLFQFDSTGKEVNHFSPQVQSTITSIEAANTMNVFIFYRDLQKYLILNRFLFQQDLTDFNKEEIGFAYMAGLSLDNNLWIFDNFSFSLKKYDLQLHNNTIETPLELILSPDVYNINLIREYQNKVYLNNLNEAIIIFDNLGNHNITLPFKTSYFNFLNEEIYFIDGSKIVLYNPFKHSKRTLTIPFEEEYKFCLLIGKNVLLFKHDLIDFYRVTQ